MLEYYYTFTCSCLLFNEDNYIIFGGTYSSSYSNSEGKFETRYEIKIFNGNFQNNLGNNQIKNTSYIETAYIGDKSYILLAEQGFAKSYDYKNNNLTEYKPKNLENKENQYITFINLFNQNNKIYLLTSYNDGRIVIFDFYTAEEKGAITVGESSKYIYGLCSLNEKYFLAGIGKEIKVINFDKRMCIKNYENLGDKDIKGIKKIKIPEKGEFIISYSKRIITLWKINN